TARGVLYDRRARSRSGDFLGGALPGSRFRHNRGQARLGDVAEDVARRSYGKLIAFLAARNRDVAAAEDALSEAFAAALENWPHNGTPNNPEAWLLTAARRRMIDQMRRANSSTAAIPELQL